RQRDDGKDLSLEIRHCLDRTILSHHDNGGQLTGSISQSNGPSLQFAGCSETTGAYPGEGRIPCHMYVSVDECFDLALIVRIQHVVHPERLARKIAFESLP